jgi:outer membrane protein assembly factor BamA
LATNTVGFASRETRLGFITDRTGISVSQEARWGHDHYIFNYGYRFEHTLSKLEEPDPFFPDPIPLNVAPLTLAFSRETRDDLLDATRGSFLSNTFEWAPEKLGSDLRFVRYFGQFFKYFPLGGRKATTLRRGVGRSRFVYATGVRLGLAKGLGGQILPPSEKFFGGGGTSLRGFVDDTLGPTDFFGDPTGGNAVFLLNNELRFPLRGMFDGVAFVDVGNVYEAIGDIALSDLRKSAGFGLRVRTPFFLLRADYGLKLDRRTGESAGQIFFSIGQAF